MKRLPKWILWGGGILAFSAGCINSTTLMGFTHLSVSHVTGNVTLFSAAISHGDYKDMLFIGASLLSFLAGAIISGMIVGQRSLVLGRRYGMALLAEAGLLVLSFYLFHNDLYLGQLCAAMACGLQNSMIATYSGAVIRTTHLTGLTSDLGAALGNWLAGRGMDKLTVIFQAMIWYAFCGGGAVGAYLFAKYNYWTLILPIVITLFCAGAYVWLSRQQARRHHLANYEL
ncbi:DUF1275 domain-containing protein [Suttonella sp. R2A3]|uniref:YoaK family protein n=1 Tax=Suttonella sp. R2A3 TaxID=2908648 RepID=UPI001F194D43|nr:YoaK family protein [Suttonella sp. R2A3]UJF24034.1 DUF1275 domain-containing protein [Suttonella sp. R2A3]